MTNTITTQSPTSSEKRTPNKVSIYNEFILWTAMPHSEKKRLGLETQGAFAEYYKIHIDTTSDWKKRSDFEKRVDAILKMWATDKTPDVVHSIYRSAVKGNPYSQQLWLGYFKGYNPKKIEEPQEKVEVSENDFRYIVNVLPEPYKTKFNEYITEIITTANAIRNARQGEDHGWDTPRPEITILEESDIDARDVSSVRTDGLAKSYSRRSRCDLGTYTVRHAQVSENNNQGTPWRRQE